MYITSCNLGTSLMDSWSESMDNSETKQVSIYLLCDNRFYNIRKCNKHQVEAYSRESCIGQPSMDFFPAKLKFKHILM